MTEAPASTTMSLMLMFFEKRDPDYHRRGSTHFSSFVVLIPKRGEVVLPSPAINVQVRVSTMQPLER